LEKNRTLKSTIKKIIGSYEDILDMENSSKYNLVDKNNMGNIFKEGIYEDIDNIIKNVHSKISIDDSDNNIETLSVSDEEITSIIEDTADIQILKGGRGRPKKGTRTLNI
jgi:Glu-tRNA(Gln) amidotransferase subunit E-like FAD-binding protein